MKVGDLIKTVFRDAFAVVTHVWFAISAGTMAAEFVYPDGKKSSQPQKYIKEVINAGR